MDNLLINQGLNTIGDTHMSAVMVYLNPNLTKEEADELYNESVKLKKELTEKMFNNANSLPADKRVSYILSVLPYITML